MPDNLVRSRADVEDVKPEAGRTAEAPGETYGRVIPYGAPHHRPTGHEPTGDGRNGMA